MEPTAVAEAGTESPIATSVAPTTKSLSPTVSLGSTALTGASDSPTPASLFVCGDDYSDAVNNVCGLTPCPNGDVSCCVCALIDAAKSSFQATSFLTIDHHLCEKNCFVCQNRDAEMT
jgi:hypothetical protein